MYSDLSLGANNHANGAGKVWLLWPILFICMYAAFIYWRIHAHVHHFYTVDGGYFLQITNALLEGKRQPFHLIINHELRAPYQPLYPLYLATLSLIFGLNGIGLQVLSAVFISGGLLLGFANILGRKWFYCIPLFFFDHYVEVISQLWSEGLLLLLVFWGVFFANKWMCAPKPSSAIVLVLILSFMLLTRHAAIFIVVGLVLILWHSLTFKQIIKILTPACIIYSGWCLYIFVTTGYLTGGPRYQHSEEANVLLAHLASGVVNVFLPWRDMNIKSVYVLLIQLVMVAILIFRIWKTNKDNFEPLKHLYIRLLLATSAVYLLIMIAVRSVFYFAEPLDLRLTAPSAFLFWLATVFVLVKKSDMMANILWLMVGIIAVISAIGLHHLKLIAGILP